MRLHCLVISLVLLAAFASDSWGQSKQPPSKTSQQKATQQERGSEDLPVLVKVIPTEKTKDDLAREDAKDKEKLAVDNRIATLTGELALYAKLLFIATAAVDEADVKQRSATIASIKQPGSVMWDIIISLFVLP
jgi:hypothetical protein